VAVTAVEDIDNPENGSEIAGFIADYKQFAIWAKHDT